MPIFRTAKPHKPGTVIDMWGEAFTFDDEGYGTLTTETKYVIERLRSIPEGFKEVIDAPAKPSQDKQPEPGAFVLKNGDETLDLATLDDAALAEFVKANSLKVHHKTVGAGGDKLRAAIVAALSA